MPGRLRRITPPAIEPVTLAHAKLHARIDHDIEDALLATFAAAARQHGEHLTARQFVEAEWEIVLEAFPQGNGPIALPRPPFQAVAAVAYVDLDGEEQTLADSNYHVDTDGHFGAIYPAEAAPWPATRCRRNGGVIVRFRTGWPVVNGAASTPEAIQAWMLARVTGLYEQREAFALRPLTPLPREFERLVRWPISPLWSESGFPSLPTVVARLPQPERDPDLVI